MANRADQRCSFAILALVVGLLALAAASAERAQAAAGWSPVTLPKLSVFELPLGVPSDLSCQAANRCLLSTNGGVSGFGPSVFSFNGQTWRQYASVCGAYGDYGRVVWAGPADFWLITDPSPPFGQIHQGESLCHIVNGEVVGSYSSLTVQGAAENAYFRLNSGACLAADDCWFGGDYAELSGGLRQGAFHLHWDGVSLTPVYAPQGRAVTDVVAFDGEFLQSVAVGASLGDNATAFNLTTPEPEPRLLHTIAPRSGDPSAFANVDFAPAPVAGLPAAATELYALATNSLAGGAGDRVWAVGGGALSGPDADGSNPFDRGPFAATRQLSGTWSELTMPDGLFGPDEQFIDVAAVPGTGRAVAAIVDGAVGFTLAGTPSEVAWIDADGTVERTMVSATRGTIVKLACTSSTACWAATAEGRIMRFHDPADPEPAIDQDPAFTTTITYRPNEVAEQAVSDNPPVDDSLLFAPPEETPEPEAEQPPAKRIKAAVQKVRSKLIGTKLVIRFRVIRKARVSITAYRKGRVVARARSKLLSKGSHRLTLRLKRDRWPTKLKLRVKEPGDKPQSDDTATAPEADANVGGATSASCTSCGR
jgi:hypothetical protein